MHTLCTAGEGFKQGATYSVGFSAEGLDVKATARLYPHDMIEVYDLVQPHTMHSFRDMVIDLSGSNLML